jgi:anti-anti-sigma regulatory factor
VTKDPLWSLAVGTDVGPQAESPSEGSPPLFQIELLEHISGGCLARMSGHLVGDTVAALWSIEPMMDNEARVVLDLSGVETIDSVGLEETVRLMDAIRAYGGSLFIEQSMPRRGPLPWRAGRDRT